MAKILANLKKQFTKSKTFLRTEIKNPIPKKYQAAALVGPLLIPSVLSISALKSLDSDMESLQSNVNRSDNEELIEMLNRRSNNLSAMTNQKGHTISIQETELEQLTQHLEALENENSRLSTELHQTQGDDQQDANSNNDNEDDKKWWDRFRDDD